MTQAVGALAWFSNEGPKQNLENMAATHEEDYWQQDVKPHPNHALILLFLHLKIWRNSH